MLCNGQKIPLLTTSEEGVKPTQNWPVHSEGFNFIFVSEHHIDQILKRYLFLCSHTPLPCSLSSKSNIFMGPCRLVYYEMNPVSKIGTDFCSPYHCSFSPVCKSSCKNIVKLRHQVSRQS